MMIRIKVIWNHFQSLFEIMTMNPIYIERLNEWLEILFPIIQLAYQIEMKSWKSLVHNSKLRIQILGLMYQYHIFTEKQST